MSTVNAPLIKAKLGLRKVPPAVVLARANLVYTGIKDNPNDYPAPTPDLPTFKGEIDTLAVKVMAAMRESIRLKAWLLFEHHSGARCFFYPVSPPTMARSVHVYRSVARRRAPFFSCFLSFLPSCSNGDPERQGEQ